MDLDDIVFSSTTPGRITPKVTGRLHEFYLSGHLEAPDQYIEWFDAIRNAGPDDTVKLYINCYGGDLYTGIQFMRVLTETEAHVITSVEGACMSAATMIFLCADEYEITPFSSFMFHNYSGGTVGKGGEQFDQIIHERKWSEGFLSEIYQGFLTPAEVKSLLDNKDMWMDVEEVARRMDARALKLQELADASSEESSAV